MLPWLRRALGISSGTGAASFALVNLGHGGFNFEVVGEQSYQNRLRKVSAGRVERGERVIVGCHLRYEINSHTHEPAVRVDTSGGRTVGYFPAEQAELYASALDKLERGGSIAECQGVLVGGQPDKPSFGIWLDFKPNLLTARGGPTHVQEH
jgi:hypothetical protein